MRRSVDPFEMSLSMQPSIERVDPFSDQFERSYMQPSMEKFVEEPQQPIHNDTITTGDLVSNGSVDKRGRIADKRTTGGWRACRFIIVNEVAERLAFFAIAVNLVAYLALEMHESLPSAITHVTDWLGAAYVLTLFGAFLADAYLGRFLTIIIFSGIYAVGMVLLTLSASIDSLRPPLCTARPCTKASGNQKALLYIALSLIAIGTGGIKPCVSSFGADQFDETDPKELQKKYAFFNWFFFAINMGAILAITLLVYVQDKKGWAWGFAVPTGFMILSILILVVGVRYFRFQKPMGSPFTRFFQVLVASLRNHIKGVEVGPEAQLYELSTVESDIKGAKKQSHTSQYSFLDKAAIVRNPEEGNITSNRWKLCTVTQVEELKSFIRILPIWATTIALSISYAQFSTTFRSQASIMDRNLGPHFTIPAGSVPIFGAITPLVFVPLYERLIVPFLRKITGRRRGITSLQRMGIGLFISIFAMIFAAIVEEKRRGYSPNPKDMSVFWLFPQFFLMGIAELFTYVGQLEFFYDEATDGTRSISSAMFLSTIGIGSWISTGIVKVIERATGGQERGWLRNDLNHSRLERFYFILAGISGVNFLVYLWVSWSYKGKNGVGGTVVDESLVLEITGDGGGGFPAVKRGVGAADERRELRSVVF